MLDAPLIDVADARHPFAELATEDAARAYLECLRWQDGIVCPHCVESDKATSLNGRIGYFKCRACKRVFTVRAGTILFKSNVSLRKWLRAIYLFQRNHCQLTEESLATEVGIAKQSARNLLHRLQMSSAAHNDISNDPENLDPTLTNKQPSTFDVDTDETEFRTFCRMLLPSTPSSNVTPVTKMAKHKASGAQPATTHSTLVKASPICTDANPTKSALSSSQIDNVHVEILRSTTQTAAENTDNCQPQESRQSISDAYSEIKLMNRVHNVDFLQSEVLLADRKFDIIIADPPYNIGKDFGVTKDEMPLDEYVSWSISWIQSCLKRLNPNGVMYVYGFPEIIAHIAVNFPINKQRWLAWHYTNKNVPGLRFWQRSHETILCMWTGTKPKLDVDAIRESYTAAYRNCIGKPRKPTKGRYSNGATETIYNGHDNGALPRDVIKQPALSGGAGRKERVFVCKTCDDAIFLPEELKEHDDHEIEKHPTQKPLNLTKRLLLSVGRNEQTSVLIPFAGTGSECVVSQRLGMSFVGFELSPRYTRFATLWLEKAAAEMFDV